MKKIIYVFAAATMLLASCSSDDNTITDSSNVPVKTLSKKDFKLNINIANPEDEGTTRAFVKTGWIEGDKLNIWFDDNTNTLPDFVIKYNGSAWETDKGADVSENMPVQSGTMKVVYDGDVKFCTKNDYSYDEEKQAITATIDNWTYLTEIQVVVKGISPNEATNYTLSCDQFTAYESYNVTENTVTANVAAVNTPVRGISNTNNSDGVVFVFAASGKYNQAYNYEFTLTNTSNNFKTYFVGTNKTITKTSAKLIGLKLNSANFLNYRYVSIGEKKWATMNLGATTVAGSPYTCYGDYYAWGETEPRYSSLTWGTNGPTITWKTQYETIKYTDKYNYAYPSTFADAATAQMGEGWRAPTSNDFNNLITSCGGDIKNGTFQSTVISASNGVAISTDKSAIYCLSSDQNSAPEYTGVRGLLFVYKVPESSQLVKLFLPASGNISSSFNDIGLQYWTSNADSNTNGYYLNGSISTTTAGTIFSQTTNTKLSVVCDQVGVKYRGYPIRPVHD